MKKLMVTSLACLLFVAALLIPTNALAKGGAYCNSVCNSDEPEEDWRCVWSWDQNRCCWYYGHVCGDAESCWECSEDGDGWLGAL